MIRRLPLCLLLLAKTLFAQSTEQVTTSWNLANIYAASEAVFYGKLVKSVPEPNFKTGVMGVDIKTIESFELPMEEIVWAKARELTFQASEQFKAPATATLSAYQPDPKPNVWTHVQNEAGDVFLAQPEAPARAIENLEVDDEGLFFVRHYLGSNIPVIYQMRFGQNALDDLTLLRQYQANGGKISLETLRQQNELAKLAQAERDAKAFKVFEDDYYKILRIQDLDIRSSLLNDLITRMGYTGRWEYFAFKERYLKLHGTDLESKKIPSGPEAGLEKLWHDISGELEKIDFVKKARRK